VTNVASRTLARGARDILEEHWRPEGFTVPHAGIYPWRWLWDSCFHALVWAVFDPERALSELAAVFRWQHDSGFVPHIGYATDPVHAGFWGHPDASTITQPPVYGHTVAALERRGVPVPAELRERAVAGVRWLLEQRQRDGGEVVIVHPWESGCDDSVHWDAWCPGGRWTRPAWYRVKGELVASLRLDAVGAAVANPAFEVASPGFSAIVAFAAAELGLPDAVPMPIGPGWAPVTLDDLLVALVPGHEPVLDRVEGDPVFTGAFGPPGVRRDDRRFDGSRYWRGATWPQLQYLLWVAARRAGRPGLADDLAARSLAGALRSGFAEHWHPDTGAPGGARPQSWSTLPLVMTAGG
jgi:hypothetical protein